MRDNSIWPRALSRKEKKNMAKGQEEAKEKKKKIARALVMK